MRKNHTHTGILCDMLFHMLDKDNSVELKKEELPALFSLKNTGTGKNTLYGLKGKAFWPEEKEWKKSATLYIKSFDYTTVFDDWSSFPCFQNILPLPDSEITDSYEQRFIHLLETLFNDHFRMQDSLRQFVATFLEENYVSEDEISPIKSLTTTHDISTYLVTKAKQNKAIDILTAREVSNRQKKSSPPEADSEPSIPAPNKLSLKNNSLNTRNEFIRNSLLKKRIKREWAENIIDSAIKEDSSNIIWIVAPLGFGKSTLMANLSANFSNSKTKKDHAYVVCSKQDTPQKILESIVFQLSGKLPSYKSHVNKKLAHWDLTTMSSEEYFSHMFLELPTLPFGRIYVLIDGIDELAETNNSNTLAKILVMAQDRFPSWLRFIITTRENDFGTKNLLNTGRCITFDQNQKECENDISTYISTILKKERIKLSPKNETHLKRMCEGNFLIAHLLLQQIRQNKNFLDNYQTPPQLSILLSEILGQRVQRSRLSFSDCIQALSLLYFSPIPIDDLRDLAGFSRPDFAEFQAICGIFLENGTSYLGKTTLKFFHSCISEYLNADDTSNFYYPRIEAIEKNVPKLIDRLNRSILTDFQARLLLSWIVNDYVNTSSVNIALNHLHFIPDLVRLADKMIDIGNISDGRSLYCDLIVWLKRHPHLNDIQTRYLAICHARLGDTFKLLGQLKDALQSYSESIQIRSSLTDNSSKLAISNCHMLIGDLLVHFGEDIDIAKAEHHYKSAINILRSMPEDIKAEQLLPTVLFKEADRLKVMLGQVKNAAAIYSAQLSVVQNDLSKSQLLGRLSDMKKLELSDLKRASLLALDSLMIREKAFNPQKLEDQRNLSAALRRYGDTLTLMGRYNDSIKLYERAQPLDQTVFEKRKTSEDLRSVSLTNAGLGSIYLLRNNSGDLEKARHYFEESNKARRKTADKRNLPEDYHAVIVGEIQLGDTYLLEGRYKDAIDIYKKARPFKQKLENTHRLFPEDKRILGSLDLRLAAASFLNNNPLVAKTDLKDASPLKEDLYRNRKLPCDILSYCVIQQLYAVMAKEDKQDPSTYLSTVQSLIQQLNTLDIPKYWRLYLHLLHTPIAKDKLPTMVVYFDHCTDEPALSIHSSTTTNLLVTREVL